METRTRAFHRRHCHFICDDLTWCIDRNIHVEGILPGSFLRRAVVLAGVATEAILFQREDGTHGG